MPRNSDNNTIVKTLFTTCSPPDVDVTTFLQYNYNGKINYAIDLLLESDPAALQALGFISIQITGYKSEIIPAKKFVS